MQLSCDQPSTEEWKSWLQRVEGNYSLLQVQGKWCVNEYSRFRGQWRSVNCELNDQAPLLHRSCRSYFTPLIRFESGLGANEHVSSPDWLLCQFEEQELWHGGLRVGVNRKSTQLSGLKFCSSQIKKSRAAGDASKILLHFICLWINDWTNMFNWKWKETCRWIRRSRMWNQECPRHPFHNNDGCQHTLGRSAQGL